MSLIKELQNDILDPSTSLSSILRKAKVLASKLGNERFKGWVDNELNGYPDSEEELPDYRRGRAESYGHFAGPRGARLNNFLIPSLNLPDKVKGGANKLSLVQGVGVLESLLEDTSADFHIPWPANIVAIISDKVMNGYMCVSAWKSVSRSQLKGVLESVRNRLLTFVLELEEEHPQVSESEDAVSKVPKEQVASAVNTIIFGSYNVVASGLGVDQRVDQQILQNDLDALLRYMEDIGVPADEVKELKEAVDEDGSRKEPGKLGPKVAGWVGKMTKKILEGTWNVSIAVVSRLIRQALFSYYGWQ